jgi:hypothetical protein
MSVSVTVRQHLRPAQTRGIAAQRASVGVSSAHLDAVQAGLDTRAAPNPLPRRRCHALRICHRGRRRTRVTNGFLSHRPSPRHSLTTWTSSKTVAVRGCRRAPCVLDRLARDKQATNHAGTWPNISPHAITTVPSRQSPGRTVQRTATPDSLTRNKPGLGNTCSYSTNHACASENKPADQQWPESPANVES